jgi:hypothetical protein
LAVPVAPDWGASETITEAKLDSISTVLNFLLAPPCCYAYKTANGSLAHATWDALSLNAEAYDSGGIHDNASNNSRLVAPESGLYEVKGNITFDINTNGIRGINIRKNAASVQTAGTSLIMLTPDANGTSETRVFASVDHQMTAGDYLETFGYQNSGGGLSVIGGTAGLSFLSIRFVRRTV